MALLQQSHKLALLALVLYVGAMMLYRVEVPLAHEVRVARPRKELRIDGSPPSGRSGTGCRASQVHAEYWGKVVQWGANFRKQSPAQCCEACIAHAAQAARKEEACNVWTYCPGSDPSCRDHQNECWLKWTAVPQFPDVHSRGPDCPWISGSIYEPLDEGAARLHAGTLDIITSFGNIAVQLRPDIAPKVVDDVKRIAREQLCDGCNFYRSEAKWTVPYGPPYALVQGTLRNTGKRVSDGGMLLSKMEREGTPVVQRGHVCLIGEGPDFFVALSDHPEWGTGHTVFGTVANMSVLDVIEHLPVKQDVWGTTRVTPLVTPIPFTLHLDDSQR